MMIYINLLLLGPEDFVLDLTVVRIAKIQGLFIMIKYATAVRIVLKSLQYLSTML